MRFRVRTIAKRSCAVPTMFADLNDLVETTYILIPKGATQGFPKQCALGQSPCKMACGFHSQKGVFVARIVG